MELPEMDREVKGLDREGWVVCTDESEKGQHNSFEATELKNKSQVCKY